MRGFLLLSVLLVLPCAGTGTAAADGTRNPLVGQAFGSTAALEWMGTRTKALRFADAQYTLVRWWTNRCPHCSASLPALARLDAKYRARGFRLVAVYHPKGARLRGASAIRAYLAQLGFTGDAAADWRWTKLKDLMRRGQLRSATSVSFLVDREGVVRWVHPGPRLYATKDARWKHADRAYKELDALLDRTLADTRGRILHWRSRGVFTCAPDGRGPARIQLAHKPAQMPAWDSAGKRLAYASVVRTSYRMVVSTMDGKARAYVLGAGMRPVGRVRWSPKGDALLFLQSSSGVFADRVSRLDLTTGKTASVGGQGAIAACWSPNGGKIAVVVVDRVINPGLGRSGLREYEAAVDIHDLASGDRTRLVAPKHQISDVSWAPDGSLLALATERGVRTVRLDNGRQRLIAEVRARTAARWSPDSTRLLVRYPLLSPPPLRNRWDLVVLARDGRVLRRWRDDGSVHGATWSPSGKRIAFVRGPRLYRVGAASGTPELVFEGVGAAELDWR